MLADQPRFTRDQFQKYQQSISATQWAKDLFDGLDAKAFTKLRETLLLLVNFTDRVEDAGRVSAPHLIARYSLDLSSDFHSLYSLCRILCEDDAQALARLLLVDTIRTTLSQALDLLGVSAPEHM